MRAYVALLAVACLLVLSGRGTCQTLETILESYEESEVPDLDELLRSLVPEPISINKISEDSLAALWFFSSDQIAALRDLHRRQAPHITSEQLRTALDLPEHLIALLFKTSVPVRASGMSRTIQKRSGVQQRLGAEIRRAGYRAGLLLEKDAGESRLDDFRAGFLKITPRHSTLSLLLGSFTLQSGAGLIFAGTYGLPTLSVPAQAVRLVPPRIFPQRSAAENIAFSGGAAQYAFGRTQFTVLHSVARRDARLTPENTVSSLPADGYHRTLAERRARNALRETTSGLILHSRISRSLQMGLNYLGTTYDTPLDPPDLQRRHFAFRGQTQKLGSIFSQFTVPNERVRLVAEAAFCDAGKAVVAAATFRADKRNLLSAAFWHADPGFDHPYGALPGKRVGDTANEHAFYLGLENRSRFGRLWFYALRAGTPWRTYRIPRPEWSAESAVQWEKRIARGTAVLARVRQRRFSHFAVADTLPNQAPGPAGYRRSLYSWRLQFRTRIAKGVKYRVRLDGAWLADGDGTQEQGASQLHEVTLRTKNFFFAVQYTYFVTDSYASRVYHFEYALPGLLLPVTLSGSGERLFVRVRWQPGPHFRLAAYTALMRKEKAPATREIGFQLDIL